MNTIGKKLLAVDLLLLPFHFLAAQEITRNLKSFKKIIVSPRINLVLEKGDQESIRLVYSNVPADKINITIQNNTLRVYLDDAKVNEKTEQVTPNERRSIYHNANLTAYVTYREIEHLEIRGNQELTCNGPLRAERFTLKAYGENEIKLASVKADYLRTSLYGENELKITGGKAEYQKYKLFGENKIDTHELRSYSATTNTFGESQITLSTQDQLRINAFGESQITYNGDADVNKGLVFGNTTINKLN